MLTVVIALVRRHLVADVLAVVGVGCQRTSRAILLLVKK